MSEGGEKVADTMNGTGALQPLVDSYYNANATGRLLVRCLLCAPAFMAGYLISRVING